MLLCVVPFLFVNGNKGVLKNFLSSRKCFEKCELKEYKNVNEFISFLIQIEILLGLFFSVVASVVFVFNLDNRMTMGPNLATILEAPFFALCFTIVLLPLQVRAKIRAILCMENDDSDDTQTVLDSIEKVSDGKKSFNIISIVKILVVAVWICTCIFALNYLFTKSESKKNYYILAFDIPSLLLIILYATSYFLLSGTGKYFFKGFAILFTGKKISISQKAKYEETFTGLIKTLLCTAGISVFIALMAILCNLQDFAYLPPNYNVAILCFLYAVFGSIILLVCKSILTRNE